MSIEDKGIIINTEETALKTENVGEKTNDVESCVTQLRTADPTVKSDIDKDEPFCDNKTESICSIVPEGKQNGEIQMSLDGVLGLVDEIENQVEHFREEIKRLEEEKSSLKSTVNFISQMVCQSSNSPTKLPTSATANDIATIDHALEEDKLCTKNIGLSVVDCEEVKASLDRINRRIDAVQVRILTSRDLEQTKSLEKIHDIIRQLYSEIDLACEVSEQKDSKEQTEYDESLSNSSKLESVLQKAKMYRSSCTGSSSERKEVANITDSKFESILLACTSDDQKQVKKSLSTIIDQLEAMSGKEN